MQSGCGFFKNTNRFFLDPFGQYAYLHGCVFKLFVDKYVSDRRKPSRNFNFALDDLCQKLGVTPDEICYVGDDLPDLPVLQRVGLPATVADAHPLCLAAARWRSRAPGGAGAVRELCEFILKSQGLLAAEYARYGGRLE